MIQHLQEAGKLSRSARKNHGGDTRIKYDNPSSKSNQKEENSHYTPVLLGNIDGRLGKGKFHSLRIL